MQAVGEEGQDGFASDLLFLQLRDHRPVVGGRIVIGARDLCGERRHLALVLTEGCVCHRGDLRRRDIDSVRFERERVLLRRQTIVAARLGEDVLPKARSDYRLPAEKYALAFEAYGIDIPPAQVASMAHAAFSQYQSEMAPLAAQIARANNYPSADYRAVIAELKKKQITGEAILPFFTDRLH